MTPLQHLETHMSERTQAGGIITDTTFLAELWALDRTRDVALEIADRSRAEFEASKGCSDSHTRPNGQKEGE